MGDVSPFEQLTVPAAAEVLLSADAALDLASEITSLRALVAELSVALVEMLHYPESGFRKVDKTELGVGYRSRCVAEVRCHCGEHHLGHGNTWAIAERHGRASVLLHARRHAEPPGEIAHLRRHVALLEQLMADDELASQARSLAEGELEPS